MLQGQKHPHTHKWEEARVPRRSPERMFQKTYKEAQNTLSGDRCLNFGSIPYVSWGLGLGRGFRI